MSRPLREVTIYLTIAFSLAIVIALSFRHAGIGVLLSAFIPVVSVVIVTFTATPRGERRALWGSFGLRRSGKQAWAFAALVPMLMALSAYGVAVVLGVGHLRELDVSGNSLVDWSLNLVSSLVLMSVIFLGEEIGWRAYMLPRVQQLTSRRRAGLVTGFVHGCFHLPLILIATTYDQFGSRWFVAPMVVATLTFGGVFYAYLWDRTGTVWPVSIAHGAVNIAFGLGGAAVVGSHTRMAYVADESGLATFVVVAAVAVVLLTRARVWREDAAESAVAEDRRAVPVRAAV